MNKGGEKAVTKEEEAVLEGEGVDKVKAVSELGGSVEGKLGCGRGRVVRAADVALFIATV